MYLQLPKDNGEIQIRAKGRVNEWKEGQRMMEAKRVKGGEG